MFSELNGSDELYVVLVCEEQVDTGWIIEDAIEFGGKDV